MFGHLLYHHKELQIKKINFDMAHNADGNNNNKKKKNSVILFNDD